MTSILTHCQNGKPGPSSSSISWPKSPRSPICPLRGRACSEWVFQMPKGKFCALVVLLAVECNGAARADDRQECLNGDSEPILALSACTRIATSSDDRKVVANAYYNRGRAF